MDPHTDVVVVERRGWSVSVHLAAAASAADIFRLANQLQSSEPGRRYVAVVPADGDGLADQVLALLPPQLAEVVCCDSVDVHGPTGHDLAMRALEELGFGQDFVFEVASLEAAVTYAVDVLAAQDRQGWEGEFLVVPACAADLDRARTCLGNPT